MKEVIGADITFTVKDMNEGYDIPAAEIGQKSHRLDLLLRKGAYPYDYMDSFERLQETQLPLHKSEEIPCPGSKAEQDPYVGDT